MFEHLHNFLTSMDQSKGHCDMPAAIELIYLSAPLLKKSQPRVDTVALRCVIAILKCYKLKTEIIMNISGVNTIFRYCLLKKDCFECVCLRFFVNTP